MWHCQTLKRQLTVQEAQTLTKTSNSGNFSDKHRIVKKGHRERDGRGKLKMIMRWLMAQHARASPDSVEGTHLYQGAVSVTAGCFTSSPQWSANKWKQVVTQCWGPAWWSLQHESRQKSKSKGKIYPKQDNSSLVQRVIIVNISCLKSGIVAGEC